MSYSGPSEDRLAIRELIESYADAVTQRDAIAWASLWCEQSRWLMPDLATRLEGKETIVSTWLRLMAQYHGPAEKPWAFSFASVLGAINVAGDRATVRSYSLEAFADANGKTTHLKGQYDDLVIRQDGRWLFEERSWRLMPLEDHAAFLGN